MPRISSDALAMRNVLLQLDWQSRHAYFRRCYARSNGYAFARKVASLMSPDELLQGIGGCTKVEPFAIIPLPPSGPRYRQLKLSSVGINVVQAGATVNSETIISMLLEPCRPRVYLQLKLSYFGIRAVRRRTRQLTIKDYFKQKQN